MHVVSQIDWQGYQAEAQAMGFAKMAAAPSHRSQRAADVAHWVEQGFHADMAWYGRNLERRVDPGQVLPGCRAVIMLTSPYTPQPVELAGQKLARYAAGDDYHDVLLKRLKRLIAVMRADYPHGEFRPYVDTGPVLERYWAEQAGLGWIGKNGCLIDREQGSYLFLAAILTTLTVPTGQPHTDFCGQCTACIDACPTNAIVAEQVVDSRKCISYLNIESRGPFPADTPDFSHWIFGCDICQEVCPWTNKFAVNPLLTAFEPRPTFATISADDLAQMDQATFRATFRKSPIKRTKQAGLQRNLAHIRDDDDPS